MRSLLLPFACILMAGTALGQFNTANRFHVGVGGAVGAHATRVDETLKLNLFGVQVRHEQSKTDGAATTTVPVELGYGLGKAASLGIVLEAGRYVPDSNATNQRNTLTLVALQPRFYLVNRDGFALSASLQAGGSFLHLVDDTPNKKVDARYSGPAVGLGAGAHVPLGEHVAIEAHLRYIAARMTLREGSINGQSVMDFYEAVLTTGGVVLQAGVSFRFGG